MTVSSKLRSLAAALGALSVVAACGGGGGGSSETLAADQTFRFGLSNDVTSLDPAHVSSAAPIARGSGPLSRQRKKWISTDFSG